MTTYISIPDLDSVLDGFVAKYYGTFLDGGEDLTIGSQFYVDSNLSFTQANEWLAGIAHIKQLPMGTQPNSGNYPFSVRMLQANLMVYTRLKSRHYGEFNDGVPGWITIFKTRAQDIYSDIKGQNVVFDEDVTQGEQGIGMGSFTSKTGLANWFTNWETGVYTGDDFPRTFVFKIDGTTVGNGIGESTFKWSNDNGVTWSSETQDTDTDWIPIQSGLFVRFEQVGTGSQLGYGDTFIVKCVPLNIPVKSGNVRYITWKRG